MQGIKVKISLVDSLSDQELEDVALVSDLAYRNASSPAIELLTGGKLELIPDLFRSMTLACLTNGECYIATEVATQKIVGTALWFPPGKHLWETEEIRESTGLNVYLDKLNPAAKDWWINEYRAEVGKFLDEKYRPETAQESWWLNNIAVLPEYQGNGIGSSLCQRVLDKAASNEAVGCCTDTEENVNFYKSLRFKEIGTLYMRHPTDGSEIKVWGLKQYGARG